MLDVPDELMAIGKPWEPFFKYQADRGDLGNPAAAEKYIQKLNANFTKNLTKTVERKGANGLILMVDRVANNIGGLTITFTDITDIKNREIELEAARAESEASLVRQSKIANAIAQGIIMFENGKVIFYNKQAFEMLELSDDILFEEQTFEKFPELVS